MKKVFLFLLLILFFGCSQHKFKNPHVIIKTKFGDIELELYPDKAPKSVAAFLSYIDSGYYKNAAFYRVLKEENQPSAAFKTELIQGGIWQTAKPKDLPGISHETTKQTGLSHTDGAISLARTLPGTATTEFFICVGDQPAYNYGGDANPDKQGYAVFGKVVNGMSTVKKIHHQPEEGESFNPVIDIINIVRL